MKVSPGNGPSGAGHAVERVVCGVQNTGGMLNRAGTTCNKQYSSGITDL